MQFRGKLAKAIEWIARNDEGAEMDRDIIAMFPSVALVADIWAVHETVIAQEIVRIREDIEAKRARKKAFRAELLHEDEQP